MHTRKRYALLSLVVLATMVLTLALPLPAFADEGTPPPSDTPAGDTVSNPTQPATTEVANLADSTQGVATDAIVTADPNSTPDPNGDATTAPTEAVPTQTSAASAAPTDAPANNVAAAVTAIANTGSVVTDVNGNALPLASQQAAQILSQPLPDPVICPAGSSSSSAPGCVAGFTTISSAITAASAGSVIFVQSGTYSEQVVINKSLTLIGDGSGTTTIKAPGALTNDPDGYKTLVLIDGSTTIADVSGFTISGPGPSGCNSISNGIYVRGGATANIHDNVITDIRDNPLGGCQNGIAIRVGSQAKGQTGKATITHNTIKNYQKGGIVVDNTGSSATISGNDVEGIGNTPLIAQNGIQISRGATATITNNTISGNLCDHVSCGLDLDQSAAILLYNSGNVTISNNTISNNDMGLYSLAPGSTVSVSGNAFTGNRYEGLFADQGTLNLNGNTIAGSDYGLWAYSYSGASGDTNVNLTSNQITGNSLAGIEIDQDPGASSKVNAAGSGNLFSGNAEAIVNNTTTLANFAGNWWGSAGGPLDNSTVPDACGLTSNNPLGSGQAVSPCVIYGPWLTADPFAGTVGNQDASRGTSTIIPVTGGQQTTISCDIPSVTLQVGDVQITFTGLCGYDVVMDALTKDTLPGTLGQGNNFADGISLDLLKDGKAVDTLPVGTSIQVSYPKPSGNAAILAWNGSSWIEKSSTANGNRVVVNLDIPAATVLVTH